MKEKDVLRPKIHSQDPAPRKKKKKTKKVILVFVVVLLLLLGAGGIYVASILGELNIVDFPTGDEDLGIDEENLPKSDLGNDGIVNIALFGVDQRDGDVNSRSDAIMILSVDKNNGKLKLSSIMRDALVEIEGYGQDKITKAYFYGGPQLAVKTLNQNFNLNIREYATVNFQEMAQIIDAVGGVEIDISEAERQNANEQIWEQYQEAGLPCTPIESSGLQTLNGTQAVAYARIRYVGNADFERTSRQREVLRQIFEKALNPSPTQYPSFAKQFLPLVETSLDLGDILSLADVMLKNPTLEDVRFPTNADLIGNGSIMHNGESCVYFDIDAMAQKLHDFIYNDIDPSTDADHASDGNH